MPRKVHHLMVWIVAFTAMASETILGAEASSSPTAPSELHWSFRPLKDSAPPHVNHSGWARNPIDLFVQSRLEKAGLQPSPEAEKRTLLRRVYFDLIGLPPTPEEVDSFLADASSDAYEQRVDRLLASLQFGERWGRHWLDVVRYTESQGFEYDKLRDNAWHYRDYVIRSFNEDKPYDRFIREQIAGDVMTPLTRDGLIGPSLLVCGAWDEAGNAQANATQRLITREDELEDLIGVVGQTFLGLTLNCARCHSHKFDPIPHAEYYRIKSVFEGVKHGERALATPEENKARDLQIERLKAQLAAEQATVADLETKAWGRVVPQTNGVLRSASSLEPIQHIDFSDRAAVLAAGSLNGGAEIRAGRLELSGQGAFFRSRPLANTVREKTLEAWVSLSSLDQQGGGVVSLEVTGGSPFDGIVYGERQSRRWMAGSEGFSRTKDLGAPEETAQGLSLMHWVAVYRSDNSIALYRNGEAYGKPYTPGTPLQTYRAGEASLLVGMRHTGGGKPFLAGSVWEASLYDKALSSEQVSDLFKASRFRVPREQMLAALRPVERDQQTTALRNAERIRGELSAVQPVPVSYVGVRKQPEPTHKLKRGDVRSPEEIVAPGALSAIPGLPSEFGLPADAPEGERRLRFAEWLTRPENPLPSRVIANRLWQFHFGQGLVSTPNDFGKSGSAPSHPELLDWLSSRLVASGWSLKTIHRLMVTSATYRQSSANNPQAVAKDAENLWLWRSSPKRLESETLRDAMLAVSGQLNPLMGGPSVRPFEVLKFPANAYVPVDSAEPAFNRRTVYRMNVNSGKEPLMDAFDCPDPSVRTPRRGVTTTPLQALGMMNSSFVQRQAEQLAHRVERHSTAETATQVSTAYRYALGRPPTHQETERASAVIRGRGLFHLCWALLNSTEFLYVQ